MLAAAKGHSATVLCMALLYAEQEQTSCSQCIVCMSNSTTVACARLTMVLLEGSNHVMTAQTMMITQAMLYIICVYFKLQQQWQ
jgi:hypothetical protein